MDSLKLTKHFVERWQERVGNFPTIDAVIHFLQESIQVQHGKELIQQDGTVFRQLGIYWHPDLDMVIMLDEEKPAAVTVLTRANWGRHTDGGASVMKRCKQFTHVPQERIERVKAMFGKRAAFV